MSISVGETMAILEKTLPPLLLEKKKGYTNRAVYGGLESFIGKNLLHLKQGLRDTGELSHLEEVREAFTQYSYLQERERTLVVENCLHQLYRLLGQTALSVWDLEVSSVSGVGEKRCGQLKRLQLTKIGDLFSFLPRYYHDRRRTRCISQLTPDFQRGYSIKGRITDLSFTGRKGFHIIRATIHDGSGKIDAVWFNQRHLTQILSKGTWVFLQGPLNRKAYEENGRLELSSPLLERDGEEPLLTRRLVPIYPVTDGLSQRQIQRIMKNALEEYLPLLKDPLPSKLCQQLNLLDQRRAIMGIHNPQDIQDYKRGRERMAFDELLLLQLTLARKRKGRQRDKGIVHTQKDRLINAYLSQLSFSLTPAQEAAWKEIKGDMEKEKQMFRLLQGDVGSGKTVIGALSLLKAVEGGYQGALMAPTEILAEQHYLDLQGAFKQLQVPVGFLSSGMKEEERRTVLEELAQGSLPLVVGTHSLFQEGVFFLQLGLIIIDEQHRFGVKQRSRLLNKGLSSDLLVMTATPIPRSLTQTLYGDLDLSIIPELPPGRRPIITHTFPYHSGEVQRLVLEELVKGCQIYYVCPLIQENNEQGLAAVEGRLQDLTKIYQPYSVGMLHGGMKQEEKSRIMAEFLAGRIQILVSTTVIEVGVNNPRATVIIIEDAHRFGLSQLHQLRGRVGRGERRSHCLLLGEATTEKGEKRLEAMLTCQDGFEVAEEDLRIRGPGEFLGERQHGLPEFRTADLSQDGQILSQARKLASHLIENRSLERPPFFLLKALLEKMEDRPV